MAKRAATCKKVQPKARIAPVGLTPTRRARAIELYRASGILARVWEEMNVSRTQFFYWRKEHPDFQAELDSVSDEVDRRIRSEGLEQLSDGGALDALVRDVLAANPAQVEQYRAGREKLLGYFVGQVMKASQGKANPRQVHALLREALSG